MKLAGASAAELAAGIEAGDPRTLGRAISLLEQGDPRGEQLLALLGGERAEVHVVGVTGAPGIGKSTLIGALAASARASGATVAVVSVDPTSPFSAGALLGDRIRLAEHFLDAGVFIRSMGSRGASGGLAAAVYDTIRLLGAAGKDVIFVETVGVGQGEVAVRGAVDTVLLVLMPEAGDSVQALKAGIMEIPDLIAVNKSDLPGAGRLLHELRRLPPGSLTPERIVATDALSRAGIEELWRLLVGARAAAAADSSLERRRVDQRVAAALTVASAHARRYLENAVSGAPELEALLDEVRRGRLDPTSAGHELARKVFSIGDDDRAHTH